MFRVAECAAFSVVAQDEVKQQTEGSKQLAINIRGVCEHPNNCFMIKGCKPRLFGSTH